MKVVIDGCTSTTETILALDVLTKFGLLDSVEVNTAGTGRALYELLRVEGTRNRRGWKVTAYNPDALKPASLKPPPRDGLYRQPNRSAIRLCKDGEWYYIPEGSNSWVRAHVDQQSNEYHFDRCGFFFIAPLSVFTL